MYWSLYFDLSLAFIYFRLESNFKKINSLLYYEKLCFDLSFKLILNLIVKLEQTLSKYTNINSNIMESIFKPYKIRMLVLL